MAREPDSFRVSTWPSRTTVENSSPSRTTHSAALAPPSIARRTTSVASSLRSVASFASLVSRVVVILLRIYHGGTETRRTQSLISKALARIHFPNAATQAATALTKEAIAEINATTHNFDSRI